MTSSDDVIYLKKLSTTDVDTFLPSWIKLPKTFWWNQSSMELLSQAEHQLLSCSNTPYNVRYVPLRDAGRQIWTLQVDAGTRSLSSRRPSIINVSPDAQHSVPLVLLHGLGGGLGLWVLNLDSLSRHRPIYALDLLGFGKSSRCHFSSNPNVAEIEWVESIEEWRVSMGIESMHVLGHGLGGFLAASYALRYPKRVKRLILVEAWGVAERPPNLITEPRVLPFWVRAVSALVRPFNPLIAIRAAGPWAPSILRRLRPDLGEKFGTTRVPSDVVYDYIHQCNSRSPATGETAFCTLSDEHGWAQNPLVTRIGRLPISVPISVINGARSWLDSGTGELIAHARVCQLAAQGVLSPSISVDTLQSPAKLISGRVDVHIMPQAGHHVYSDQAYMFNELINQILSEDDATQKSGI